jgi:hypothetical protein
MPYLYVRDDERRRIRVTVNDSSTQADWIASVEQQLAEGAWEFGVLVDARAMSAAPPLESIQSFLAHVQALTDVHGHRGPIAVAARNPGAIAGMQIYKMSGKKQDLEIFWSIEDAQQWLDEQAR